MTERLYRVKTVAKEYEGRKDVMFGWFCSDRRTPPRPYAELIENYDPAAPCVDYTEGCIDELFTGDEADQLVAYLNVRHGDTGTTSIEEQKLPIPNGCAGYSASTTGMLYGFFQLHTSPLPFKVEGYYDLRQHDLTDKQRWLEAKRWEIRTRIDDIEDDRLDAALAALTSAV